MRFGSIVFPPGFLSAGTLALFFAGTLYGQSNQAGYVLAAQGDWKWTSKGNAKVSAGDPVLENSTAQGTGAAAKLTIALLDGTVKSFDCPPLNPCVAAIGAFRKPPDSLYTRLFAVGKTFFAQRDAMPVYAMSRGLTAAELRHAVLTLRDQIDVSPAVRQLTPGAYRVRFRSLKDSAAVTAALNWDPPGNVSLPAANLRPGVYEAVFTDGDGARAGSITVLLTTPDKAASQQAALLEGVHITEGWPPATDPAAIHNFLTAVLLDIAQQ